MEVKNSVKKLKARKYFDERKGKRIQRKKFRKEKRKENSYDTKKLFKNKRILDVINVEKLDTMLIDVKSRTKKKLKRKLIN